ncbi:hypothetical protein PQQ59_29485 [Paraburkholderia aspalathi]|uniref:hypothetical protein n=1 Tax=Paraburkholderia aspalathi TaxID=1324617 RepID=UPI0038BC5A21
MTRVAKLNLQRLDFLPVPGLALLRPARGRFKLLLGPCAHAPLALDLKQRPLLGSPQTLSCEFRAAPQFVEFTRKIGPRLHQCPVTRTDLVLLSRDFSLKRLTHRLPGGLRLFKLLNAHLCRQQRAGALLERRFGPHKPGLQ